MALDRGTRLGAYEIVSFVGAGGMGEVYRARDSRLGRDVAIKVLPPSFSADRDRVRRFEQEARTAGGLNHPNLIVVHELGQHEGQLYIVSELLDGVSLRARLAASPLSVSRAVDYAIQIANGLAAAHEKGIIHRDLKPENIFVTADGRAKILDFGLAKPMFENRNESSFPTASVHTEPGTVVGTAGYMSPEQVRGESLDARSDLFSFGAVLYEMLSGSRAFRGETKADTMSAVLREDPPALSGSGPPISLALDRIVLHCLEKNPNQRFQSARDLAFDLQSLSVTSGSQPAFLPPKTRLLASVIAAVILLAAGVVAGILGYRRWLHAASVPTFRRLTFQRGGILEARFAPGGHTVVYSAAWEGKSYRAYALSVGSPVSRDLGLEGSVIAVSPSGELAILDMNGKLSRIPLSGGAPRELAAQIAYADWTPDGKDLAVSRMLGGQNQIEFPIGHPVYRASFEQPGFRISHSGEWLAFSECRTSSGPCGVAVLNRRGEKRMLAGSFSDQYITAVWSPDDSEVWFTAQRNETTPGLYAVDMNGRVRNVQQFPEGVYLQDIGANGDVLLEVIESRREMIVARTGERDRDLSWLDWTECEDISADGKKILFGEYGAAEDPTAAAYVRDVDGSPPIRLSDGFAERLSFSGNSALVYLRGKPPRQTVVPIGVGSASVLFAPPSIIDYGGIEWFPDGRRVVYSATDTAGNSRIYIQTIGSTVMTPISPPGTRLPFASKSLSPDGRWLVAFDQHLHFALYPTGGGAPRPVIGLSPQMSVMQWTADGRRLVVYNNSFNSLPVRIETFDIATGERIPLVTFTPADPAGFASLTRARASADLRTFVYSLRRDLSRLVLARGLK